MMSLDLSLEPIMDTDEDQFCVEMMKRLDIQRRNEQFCDVILEVGSGDDQARLKAHRIVLCAASPFFYNALNSDMKEKKEGVIRLEETSKAVMEKVLEYLYTGHVDINEHNAFDLLHTADFLVVPSLKEQACELVLRKLSSSNCINAYYTAVKYQCPELEKRARDFTFANFMDVTQSNDFLNLCVTQVEEWISSDDITVKAEEEVFQVIVKWMEREESRKCHFFELFRHVRLLYVSRNNVFNFILKHPLVKGSETCTEFALNALKELSYGTEECYFAQPPRSCLKTHEDVIVTCGKKKTLCYLPLENKWYKLADMTETMSKPYQNLVNVSALSACHSKLYSTAVNSDDFLVAGRYDPSVNCWAPVKSLAGAILHGLAAVTNFQGVLYIIGGTTDEDESEGTNTVRKYNPDTNLVQEVAPMDVARYGLCAVADRNSLYAIGGLSKGEALDIVERFDPEKNSWTRIASTHEKRAFACGKVFVFGGFTGTETSHLNLIEVYDPATNIWSRTEWIGAPKYIYNAVSFKGKIFVMGLLEQGRSHRSSLQAYDVDKNEWEPCSSVPVGTQVFTIASLRIPRDILDL
ncbi:kelch-like protein 40 isoform X2 [Oculina patagonica]